MSLSVLFSKVQYTSNGSQTSLSITFPFVAATDLQVYYTDATGVDTLKVLNTDYSILIITGGGVIYWASGGGIGATPANGVRVTIKRVVQLNQLAVYVNNDAFPALTHEAALDKLTQQVQQLTEIVSRCIKIQDGEASGIVVTIPKLNDRKSKVLAFDVNGSLIVQ